MSILEEARNIYDSDRIMYEYEYNHFITEFGGLTEAEKSEMANILLSEAVLMPNIISCNDISIFKKYLSIDILTYELMNAISIATEFYGKQTIFKDSKVATAVANIFKGKKRCEYCVLSALLNNGFGDKKEIKEYIDTVSPKVFNYSKTWELLYIRAKRYIKQ